MLRWAVIFFIVAIIAGALGLSGVMQAAATIAWVLFGLFLIIALLFFIIAYKGIQKLR